MAPPRAVLAPAAARVILGPLHDPGKHVSLSEKDPMKLSPLLATVGMAAALSACLGESTGPDCDEITLQPTATVGDTVVLSTGLRYITLLEGAGAAVESCEPVAVRYEAFLLDSDTPFDATPAGQVLAFVPGRGRLIPGFEQGVIGMQVGGRRRLIVPPDLAYGPTVQVDNQGNVVVPANSTLVFDVELVEAQ